MSQTVTCPTCRTLLRSERAIPSGANLRCPGCRETFLAPDIVPLPAPARSLFGAPFVIAVTVSLLLGGSLITAAVIYAFRPQPAPVVGPNSPPKEQPVQPVVDTRLADEQKKLADAKAQLEEQKKKLQHAQLLASGLKALSKRDFAEAETALTRALELLPTDTDTVKALIEARSGLRAGKKIDEDGKKRQTEVARLVEQGRKALKEKQLAAAVRALEDARSLDPTDKDARQALTDARDALDADKAEKKRLADFRARMDAGKVAYRAERYLDALREFQAAARVMPDDLEAAQEMKKAEAKMAGVAGREKRQADFGKLIDQARTAQQATRYNEAIQTLEAALRLIPDDREGERALRAARAALKKVRTENARTLAQANEAVNLGQLEEARRLADDAAKNWAEDATAQKTLRDISRLVDNVKTTQVAYTRAVEQGALAMATNRYAAAVTAYAEALRLVPNDLESARQLRLARLALENEVRARVEFDRQMRIAAVAMSRRSYDDAVAAYDSALKLFPEEVRAVNGRSQALYIKAVTEGQRLISQRKWDDAIRAFQAALAERPRDNVALSGLLMARRNRR